MAQTKLDDLTLVKPRWLILRGLRMPLIVAIGICIFVDVYGMPTWRAVRRYTASGGSTRSYVLEFQPLERPAAVAGGAWVLSRLTSE